MELINQNEQTNSEGTVKLLLQPHERPKNIGKWILLSIQHVFAMFGATILVPIVINTTANAEVINISMALFCSGIGTLIYIALTSAKVPIYLGSSFAYMTVIGMGWNDWGNVVFICVFLVGVVYILLGFIILWTGTKWILKTFAPIVIGPVIMIIGLSAIPSALQNIQLIPSTPNPNDSFNCPVWLSALIALFTFSVAAIIILKVKSFPKTIPILLALIIGYVVTLIIHFAASKTGINLVDTTKITNFSDWEWFPSFKNIFSKYSGNPNNDLITGNMVGSAALSIVPISIVTSVEHLGDHINLGNMTGKNFIKNPGVGRTLMADGVAMCFAGLIGGPANATYAENTSVVGLTKIASVWVTGLAAIFAVVMSFIAPINQLISMIPKPVLGGIGVLLFGMISSNGIRILIDGKTEFANAKNILVILVTLTVGVGLEVSGNSIHLGGNFQITGLLLATVLGVLANLVLPEQDNLGLLTIFKSKKAKPPKPEKTLKSEKTPKQKSQKSKKHN